METDVIAVITALYVAIRDAILTYRKWRQGRR